MPVVATSETISDPDRKYISNESKVIENCQQEPCQHRQLVDQCSQKDSILPLKKRPGRPPTKRPCTLFIGGREKITPHGNVLQAVQDCTQSQ